SSSAPAPQSFSSPILRGPYGQYATAVSLWTTGGQLSKAAWRTSSEPTTTKIREMLLLPISSSLKPPPIPASFNWEHLLQRLRLARRWEPGMWFAQISGLFDQKVKRVWTNSISGSHFS